MISDLQREKFKSILGNRFSKEVQKLLPERNGKPYSISHISNVFNGKYENEEIELAIIKLCGNKLKAKKQLEKSKKQLLKKEPEVVASGSIIH